MTTEGVSGANIVALAAIGSTVIVAIGSWVFQWRTEGRRFERERHAAALDDLRRLLDEGASALRRFDTSREDLLRAERRHEFFSSSELPIPDDVIAERDEARASNRSAAEAADELEWRLRLRLDWSDVTATFTAAVIELKLDSVLTTAPRSEDDVAERRDRREQRRQAIESFLEAAVLRLGSPLRAPVVPEPWYRRALHARPRLGHRSGAAESHDEAEPPDVGEEPGAALHAPPAISDVGDSGSATRRR